MFKGRLSQDNATSRNQLRNLASYIQNKMFPGNQRNCTSKDSLGFTDSPDISKCVNYDISNPNLIVGTAAALD